MRFRQAVNLLAIVLILLASWRLMVGEDDCPAADATFAANARHPEAPTLRIYDVRDLWPRIVRELRIPEKPKSKIPERYRFSVGSSEVFTGYVATPPPPPTPQELAADRIGDLFRDYSTPDDWLSNGGSIARAHGTSGGFIAVWHTRAGHRQIERLLEAIRRADRIEW